MDAYFVLTAGGSVTTISNDDEMPLYFVSHLRLNLVFVQHHRYFINENI
jgi:hypothetical protein